MLITTPIPYANAAPHLGHLLEAVFTDTIARYFRASDTAQNSLILTMGLDQHGLKMYQKAQEKNMDPADFVHAIGQTFVQLWQDFDVQPDAFIETYTPTHQRVAQAVWTRLEKKGYLFKKKYTGLYCVGCEEFKTESQLVNGRCPLHPDQDLITVTEENYFFKLSLFQQEVEDFLHQVDVRPEFVRTEWQHFVAEGLLDMSCSREREKLPWGVPVPGDNNQVIYVWFEALINYLTAAVIEDDVHAMTDDELFAKIQTALPIQLMYCGKDIAKFHLVVFPAMLSALGLELPQQAIVHGFINDAQGRKFSKSLGNGVIPAELVEKFGTDGTRFVLLHEVNVDGDTHFNMDGMIESYNSHLADNIGNLVMRVSNLVEKNLEGNADIQRFVIKSNTDSSSIPQNNKQAEIIAKNWSFAQQKYTEFESAMQAFDVRGGLDALLEIGRNGNELLENTQPWKMVKNGQEKQAREVLEYLVWTLIEIGTRLQIFLPKSGQKITKVFARKSIQKAPILFQKYRKI